MPVFLLALLPAAGPAWLTDLDAARAEARRSGRPIFAVCRCDH